MAKWLVTATGSSLRQRLFNQITAKDPLVSLTFVVHEKVR